MRLGPTGPVRGWGGVIEGGRGPPGPGKSGTGNGGRGISGWGKSGRGMSIGGNDWPGIWPGKALFPGIPEGNPPGPGAVLDCRRCMPNHTPIPNAPALPRIDRPTTNQISGDRDFLCRDRRVTGGSTSSSGSSALSRRGRAPGADRPGPGRLAALGRGFAPLPKALAQSSSGAVGESAGREAGDWAGDGGAAGTVIAAPHDLQWMVRFANSSRTW